MDPPALTPRPDPNLTLADVVETLVASGLIKDGERARTRIALSYPPWLVLDELSPYEITRVLHAATGISVFGLELSAELVDHVVCEAMGVERLLQVR